MPTYDYECQACGEKLEIFQKITDDPVKKCPACKKNRLTRLLGTGAAIVFKGSGFYQTDYRSEGYRKAAASDSKGGSDSSSAGDPKGESKSDSATSNADKSSSSKASGKKKKP